MKTIFTILCVMALIQTGLAQYSSGPNSALQKTSVAVAKGNGKISGTVMDSTNNEPVPFATVALTDPATDKPIDGSICDVNGKFTIEKVAEGNYKIVISFIGFTNKVINNVAVSDKSEIDLGTIQIRPSVQQLKEVVIAGQKELVEEKVDRTVYNAENDATNKGGDATDVLRKVPMLSVDMDGNVSMRGSQNVKVLINNKPSTISASSVADALKQIPADMIKTVEVITSPSAKYDAEGSAGIINIITKKNALQGATLSVDGSAGTRGSNLGLNGSYRKGKLGLSLGGFGRMGYNVHGKFNNEQLTTDSLGNQILSTQTAKTGNQFGFGNYTFGLDYDFNDHNSITSSVRYGFRTGSNFQHLLNSNSYINDSLVNSTLNNVNVTDLSGTVDVSLNYTHTYKKPQHEFNILTLYSRNNRTNDFNRNLLNPDLSTLGRTKNENLSFNQEITVQADYSNPIANNQLLELGGKNIMRKVSSDFKYLTADENGNFVQAEKGALSNALSYNQNVTAAYFSYTLNFLKTYSLKAGTRYEYTAIDAHTQTEQDIKIPSYSVVVPSINISKKFKGGNMIKASFNRRIQRPSLQFLNPNVNASNPLNITVGNETLRPEFTNNYELAYNTFIKKTSFSLSTFMRNTNNAIQSVRTAEGASIITTYKNIGQENAYGFSIFTNINFSNKFTMNGGTDVYYAVLKNNDPNPDYATSNKGWVNNFRLFGSYNFAKDWGFQFFTFRRSRQVQLQGYQGGFRMYSLSIKKDFNEKKGSIGFGAENFFTPTMTVKNEINSVNVSQKSTNVMYNMSFKINFSYRIGKLNSGDNSKKSRKSVNNDDMKEGGDNNQNGAATQQAPASSPAPGGGRGK